jgi:hypothetical protein
MRHQLWSALVLLPMAWSTGADEAPHTTAPIVPEVTVVAPRPVTQEQIAGNSVPTFVRSHGNPSFRTGQLSRWETRTGSWIATVGHRKHHDARV